MRKASGFSKASWFNVGSVALGLAFLYLPIVILVIYSFNASRLVTVWGGWCCAGTSNCCTTTPCSRPPG
jgi:putrescine transport system permease protein